MAWQDFLRNNSQALTQAGAGLLTGRNPQEQFAMGAQGFMQGQQQNKTAQYIEQNFPELGQAVKAGVLSPADAFKMATEARTKKQPVYDFQILPDGTYGTFEKNAGQFNPMGKAPKADTGILSDVDNRRRAAEAMGIAPDDPMYKSYVLTGKTPREDAQPLTATDKKAILEADEMVLATQGAIPLIDRALELNDKAYSGPTAGVRGMIGGNLGIGGGQETMELDNVVASQALGQLKAIFGAAPTEGERKILLDLQGSVSQPPEVRKAIFERAKIAAQRRLDFYQHRANEMRGGEYYKPGGAAGPGNRTATGATWSVVE